MRTIALRRADWLVPAGLVLLTLMPLLGGSVRMGQLLGGAPVTPENARFMAAPLPVVAHIVSSLVFCLLGAFQFSPRLWRSRPDWHRRSGRLLVPLGFTSALSGLWMTQFYPNANFDGVAVYLMRLLAGAGMVAAMALGVSAIARRDIATHQRWMTRAYALGIGAGTQAFTHIPWFLWPEAQGEVLRAVCMGAGWVINIAVAEWVLRRGR